MVNKPYGCCRCCCCRCCFLSNRFSRCSRHCSVLNLKLNRKTSGQQQCFEGLNLRGVEWCAWKVRSGLLWCKMIILIIDIRQRAWIGRQIHWTLTWWRGGTSNFNFRFLITISVNRAPKLDCNWPSCQADFLVARLPSPLCFFLSQNFGLVGDLWMSFAVL